MQYRSGLRRTQAIDVAIWCALDHSRVAQRTTPICAIVLLRTKAPSVSLWRSWRLRTSRSSLPPFAAWAQPNLKSLAAVLYGFCLQKMTEASRRHSSIRRMSVYGMAVVEAEADLAVSKHYFRFFDPELKSTPHVSGGHSIRRHGCSTRRP